MNDIITEELKQQSKRMYESGLVIHDFGNLSIKSGNKIYIKASGRPMSTITNRDFVCVDLNSSVYKTDLKPSIDTPTHLKIYKSFKEIGGIVHTHSLNATSWAQSGKPIPCLGTTHSDYWNGDIPITRSLNNQEINGEYESEIGNVIVETIEELGIRPLFCPGLLVQNHGPFTWGKNITEAVKNAEILEYIAKMAYKTLAINPNIKKLNKILINKHFLRKNGDNAYYGQGEKNN